MLELKNLTKCYDKRKTAAVSDLNLKVNKGEIFGFIGPNGAGKTTTIKMITDIIKPTAGDIIIDGINMKEDPIKCKQSFGYVPDNPDVYEKLTAREYLEFMGDIYSVPAKERQTRIQKYSTMFDISNALNDQIKCFSHGMRQKLVLTGALIHNPKLWILDEPMVGLDPMSAHCLKEEMREHCKQGNTVFFSTHVLEVAEKLCDRIAIISKGVIAAIGTVDELKEKAQSGDSTLEDIFIDIVGGNGE